MAEGNERPLMAGCARACAPCRGVACERHHDRHAARREPGGEGEPEGFRDVVQETVDAVSGATWGTRNTIMEGLFRQDMADHGEAMPSYRPPGT